MERADDNVLHRLNVKRVATYLSSGGGKCCMEWVFFMEARCALCDT